ncbi:hypothetical protein [Hyphomonas chukchiensis]|uniref:Uncharacterized protein n=1 Tax=Hyphomonas chukchiensis TaxID=1280947 RepID=A0A062UD66_9PROT|nr:hypothetical protein [Hyphomonas chukchiensis]KCZ59038.1 hypothetical protein HY30_15595 [Hyphomonas chukchiensis]
MLTILSSLRFAHVAALENGPYDAEMHGDSLPESQLEQFLDALSIIPCPSKKSPGPAASAPLNVPPSLSNWSFPTAP